MTSNNAITVGAKKLIKRWKRVDRPNLKLHIAQSEREVAEHTKHTNDLTPNIRTLIGVVGDKTQNPLIRQEARQHVTTAIAMKKFLMLMTDFHKAQLNALSHCYNENIAKAEKYQSKMDAIANQLNAINISGENGMSIEARLANGVWIGNKRGELEQLMRLGKIVAGSARPINNHRKKMTETLKLMLEMGEWAESCRRALDECDEDEDDECGPECVEEESRRGGLEHHIYNNGTISAMMVVFGQQYGVASSWGRYHGC